jgi:ubiquinone/menaquinone biosynthesis C-methylase UbiE
MAISASDGQIKLCCATLYQSDLARMLLGDVFHPGGLELTCHLGRSISLNAMDRVLDIACGRGQSAVHLAQNFACHVTGLDYGASNVTAAQAHAVEDGVAHLTDFRQGDAERIPFADETFDAIISECSFCTFPDKASAAAEMARLLRPGGRLGLTDMTIRGALPADIQSLLGWVACVAGAGTAQDYLTILQQAGFVEFCVEDQSSTPTNMINDIRRKLLGVELAINLRKLDLGDLDLNEGKRLARRAVELIESKTIGYVLITAMKT